MVNVNNGKIKFLITKHSFLNSTATKDGKCKKVSTFNCW